MQSGTKYLGGHSDLLLGLIQTNNEQLYERLLSLREAFGAEPGDL